MLFNKSYDGLDSFSKPSSWKKMNSDEKELLAILFVKQGEMQLINGEGNVLDSFKLAEQLCPDNPLIYYTQAVAFSSQRKNLRCLNAAIEALKKSISLCSYQVNVWHSLGNVYVRLFDVNQDLNTLYLADKSFEEAANLAQEQKNPHIGNVCWDWGIVWYQIAESSGETADYLKCLEKFKAANQWGLKEGEFYNDYGNLLAELGTLLKRNELFDEAKTFYQKALESCPDQYEWVLNMACLCQRQYQTTGNIDCFTLSADWFERALHLNSKCAVAWCKYGELYRTAGRGSDSLELIEIARKKIQKAYEIEPEEILISLRLVETLLDEYSYTEKLECLQEALQKIIVVVRTDSTMPLAWYLYGTCLMELGHYFSSAEHYQQSIRVFECALDKHPEEVHLLTGIAEAYFSNGMVTGKKENFEKSLYFYQCIENSIQKLPPPLLMEWGVVAMRLGEITNEKGPIEFAAEKFEQAMAAQLEAAPGEELEFEWLYNYGCAMDFLGDFHEEPIYYEKAVHVLTHVVNMEPNFFHGRYNLALALSHLGEINGDIEPFYKAIDLFHKIVQEDPEDEVIWNDYGLCLLNLATLTSDSTLGTINKSIFDQAESKFHQAVARGNKSAYYNLGCLYALLNNPDGAVHYLERAEQADCLPPLEDILHDEWLESLRNFPPYRNLIARLLNDISD